METKKKYQSRFVSQERYNKLKKKNEELKKLILDSESIYRMGTKSDLKWKEKRNKLLNINLNNQH
jgi:hypothetical protein